MEFEVFGLSIDEAVVNGLKFVGHIPVTLQTFVLILYIILPLVGWRNPWNQL
jgi:hypothetical protein